MYDTSDYHNPPRFGQQFLSLLGQFVNGVSDLRQEVRCGDDPFRRGEIQLLRDLGGGGSAEKEVRITLALFGVFERHVLAEIGDAVEGQVVGIVEVVSSAFAIVVGGS